jgi:chitinase
MAILWKAHTRLGLLSFFLLAISLFLLAPSFRSQSDAPLHTRDILQNLKNDLSLVNVSTTDSTCKKGVQCKKNACCGGFFGGDEGTCGFGPDFCGDDCDSQCDAKAECGKYADPASMCSL